MIAVTVLACNKKQDLSNPPSKNTVKKTRAAKPTTTQLYYPNYQWCYAPAINCASNVVIKPRHISVFSALNDAINTSQTAVTAFFNTSSAGSLSEYFGDDYISEFQSGDYTVKHVFNSVESSDLYLVDVADGFDEEEPEYVLQTIIE